MNYRGRFWVQKEKSEIFLYSSIQRGRGGAPGPPKRLPAVIPQKSLAAAFSLVLDGVGATGLSTRFTHPIRPEHGIKGLADAVQPITAGRSWFDGLSTNGSVLGGAAALSISARACRSCKIFRQKKKKAVAVATAF